MSLDNKGRSRQHHSLEHIKAVGLVLKVEVVARVGELGRKFGAIVLEVVVDVLQEDEAKDRILQLTDTRATKSKSIGPESTQSTESSRGRVRTKLGVKVL